MRGVVPQAYYQPVTQGVEPVDLLRLIGSAAHDYDSMDELEQVLLPADGLHPLAAQLVAQFVNGGDDFHGVSGVAMKTVRKK